MNHRQWKKKYKKQHGHNPPIEADSKKRARLIIKLLPSMIDALNDFVPQFFKALEQAARVAVVALEEMADGFCEITERWNNGEDSN